MDSRLRALAAQQGGHFTRAQALDCGLTDRDLRAAVRAGALRRVRHGAYSFADVFDALDPRERHLVLAHAVMSSLSGRVALTHQSASAAHRHLQWGWDMTEVHVTRLDGGAGRNEAGVRHHVGAISDNDLVQVGSLVCANEVRSLVDATGEISAESGVVMVDSALHIGEVDAHTLEAVAAQRSDWPGSRRSRLVVRLSNGLSESVGESRSRYLFWRNALPAPTLQYVVRNANQTLLGIADFGWEEWCHLGEFDGRLKYYRDLPGGQDPGDVVFREKRREDSLRAELFGMTRWTWGDLEPSRSDRLIRTIRQALAASRRRYTNHRTVIA
ncbi:MAG: type IV toxin-antitoxin system AbiEi family antitoxin domain-containing protein [Nocardioidaceae bacterium]